MSYYSGCSPYGQNVQYYPYNPCGPCAPGTGGGPLQWPTAVCCTGPTGPAGPPVTNTIFVQSSGTSSSPSITLNSHVTPTVGPGKSQISLVGYANYATTSEGPIMTGILNSGTQAYEVYIYFSSPESTIVRGLQVGEIAAEPDWSKNLAAVISSNSQAPAIGPNTKINAFIYVPTNVSGDYPIHYKLYLSHTENPAISYEYEWSASKEWIQHLLNSGGLQVTLGASGLDINPWVSPSTGELIDFNRCVPLLIPTNHTSVF